MLDELMLIQFHSDQFKIIYHGAIQPAIDAARVYDNKYELTISKAKGLV